MKMQNKATRSLVGEVASVTAGVACDCDGGELRAGSIANGLAGIVPVQIPGEELVLGRVDLGALDTLRDRLAVVPICDLDVERLFSG
jgi:hypothetical protein